MMRFEGRERADTDLDGPMQAIAMTVYFHILLDRLELTGWTL